MKATIKKSNFIHWMFKTGSDQEIGDMVELLGQRALQTLINGEDVTITVEELWDECNHEIITAAYFEEFSDVNYDEVGQYNITEYILIEG